MPNALKIMKLINIDNGIATPTNKALRSSEKEQQDSNHQKHSEDDRILQLVYLRSGLIRLIIRDRNVEILW